MKRVAQDYYPTPLSAFDPLIPFIKEVNVIVWEPACGDARLINRLKDNDVRAHGDDLKDGYDFLANNLKHECIVTNPPFSLALEFCTHALNLAPHVFMLLRLGFLASQVRASWWRQHHPNNLFILSKRPSFVNGKTDSQEYAWFYWGQGLTRYNTLIWL